MSSSVHGRNEIANVAGFERAILETLAYFDLFSYPMTTLEVWQNLKIKASYGDVYETLRKSWWLRARIQEQGGVWYLKKSGTTHVAQRQRRYRASKQKLTRAMRFARILRFVPWIQGIYACNSLGFLHAKPESDIDLFIVAAKDRIWTTRFCAVLLAELTGFRPKDNHAKDGLCLSFFAVDGVSMQKVAIDRNDVYYLYWMSKLMPLFVRNGLLKRFWECNRWVTEELPQAEYMRPPFLTKRNIHHKVRQPWQFGNRFEALLRRIQLKLMPPYLKDVANKSTSVVVSDEFLKFHDHDRRASFRQEFSDRLSAVRA